MKVRPVWSVSTLPRVHRSGDLIQIPTNSAYFADRMLQRFEFSIR